MPEVCETESGEGKKKVNLHFIYKTLPVSIIQDEVNIVSYSNIGTSTEVDDWLGRNKDVTGMDIIFMK